MTETLPTVTRVAETSIKSNPDDADKQEKGNEETPIDRSYDIDLKNKV